MLTRAKMLLSTPLIDVLSFDVSYRHTGWANIRYDHEENLVIEIKYGTIDNEVTSYHSFHQYAKYSRNAKRTAEEIAMIESGIRPSVVLYEMPHITQDAMSAVLTGMMWNAINKRYNGYHVEPSHIKRWSNSKRGDKKDTVRLAVKERLGYLPSRNNNVIDAIANSLMFIDKIKQVKYAERNKNTDG